MTEFPLVDFHCHLDLFPDPAAAFAHCQEAKVLTVAVTTTPRAWAQNRTWARNNTYVVPAVGLHPELVAAHDREAPLLLGLIKEARIVGEIGLDGSARYRSSFALQRKVFADALAATADMSEGILSIHSRGAVPNVLELLRGTRSIGRIKPVLHWFSGTLGQLRAAIDCGCWFSVNGAMLKNPGGRQLVASIPIDRLLTESDAPFRDIGSMTARDLDLQKTIRELAAVREVDVRTLGQTVRTNAMTILNLSTTSTMWLE